MATTVAESSWALGQHDLTRYTDAFLDEGWDALEHLHGMTQEECRRRWPALRSQVLIMICISPRALSSKSTTCV